MCGISGIINFKGIELQCIKVMTDIIRHRGPDDEGFAFFNKNEPVVLAGGIDTPADVWIHQTPFMPKEQIGLTKRVGQVGFGHRRLSILDLSPSGHQPMSYQNGRYWITFNGEIYNYLELRKELIELGYNFNTQSDTEIILASYAEWGVKCLYRLNGMWSFGIYDCINKEIFLARDRFGIKPLYYWFLPNGSFSFASEIKQFTSLPGWSSKINPQRAYDYLIYALTDHTEETMFDGVYQVPGGHFFKSTITALQLNSERNIKPEKWYDLEYTEYKGTLDEAAVEFKNYFKSAIDLHLRADVPVGSALSGGLDSSAIVCEVNNILRRQGVQHLQKTFSSCSYDERFNEKKWMDIVVDSTSVEAHYIYPRLDDIFEMISKLTWFHDEPYQSQSAFLGYHVFESAADNGVKVLLNGQGADEYLGGYGQFAIPQYREMFWKMKWVSLFQSLKESRKFKHVNYSLIFQDIFSPLLPSFIKNIKTRHFGSSNLIKSLIDNNILGVSPIHPFRIIKAKHNTVPEISKYLTFFTTLPKYLKWEDRNSMANSVEARVPFLDYRLVEFAYNLPDDFLDYQGETKRVLREGLKGILPELIRTRKDKKGFITPEERWVKEDNPELFRQKLKEAVRLSKGIIKSNAIPYFEDVLSGKLPFDYTYWRLIQFAEWIKVFDLKKI